MRTHVYHIETIDKNEKEYMYLTESHFGKKIILEIKR